MRRLQRASGTPLLTGDVYASLVDSLFGSFISLAAGAVGGTVAAGLTAWVSGNPMLWVITGLIALVASARVGIAFAYGRNPANAHDIDGTRRWDRLYGLGASCYAMLLGVWSFVGIVMTPQEIVHLVCASVTIGYSAGISGRNAGRPNIVVAQIVCAAGPLALAFAWKGEVAYVALACLLALFFWSMRGVSVSLYQTLLKALVTSRDISALAKQFDTALNNMSHGLCMFDADQRIVVINDRMAELLALPATFDPYGTPSRVLLAQWTSGGVISQADAERLERALSTHLESAKGGSLDIPASRDRIIHFTIEPMAEGGIVVLAEDITERKRAEARIAHMARFDCLTDLPNRSSFREFAARALSRATRHKETFAVLCIDLDRFKEVNDTLGHPVGDKLLMTVADRLRGLVRSSDIVARFGGDEFFILQEPIDGAHQAEALASRVIEALAHHYDVEGHRVIIGASVGIALGPVDGENVDVLLKNADMALYSAKADGRGTYRLFEGAMDQRAQARRRLELDLRAAVLDGEFQLHFQPLLNIRANRIQACEALLRWPHKERGWVSPGDFIPVAEEMGLIVEIGDWALRKACQEAMTWPDDIRVAVNLSPVQFTRGDLIASVEAALALSGLPAHRLELEITESVLIDDTDRAKILIGKLRDIGIRLSLDDFGTGYSSLSYLHDYPFDKVKIDRSFLRGLGAGTHSLTLLRGVARLSADLGMSVTVEGVETNEQMSLISSGMFIDEAQGFLISRPIPSADIALLLRQPRGRTRKVA